MTSILKYISIGLCLSIWTLTSTYGAGCVIDDGPIDELVQYQSHLQSEIADLTAKANGQCGITPGGASASAERAQAVIDRARLQFPVFDNTFLDFMYNFKVITNGEARSPVIRDGEIFYRMEQRIDAAIRSVATRCELTDEVRSAFQSLLIQNTTLENTYKQAALGTPITPNGLSDANQEVAKAINGNYTPAVTASCKTTSNIQDLLTQIQNRMQRNGKKNESALENWRIAIALFQGGGQKMTTEQYVATQRRLLQDELARQGLSYRTSQTLLGNFDCFKAKTMGQEKDPNVGSETAARARIECMINPITGVETLILPWRKQVQQARSTVERVDAVQVMQRHQDIMLDLSTMYSSISSISTPTAEDSILTINNLVDMHISLIEAVDVLSKRVKKMQNNCMKGQPAVTGGCRD